MKKTKSTSNKQTTSTSVQKNTTATSWWIVGLVVVVVSFFLYAPTLNYGFSAVDDGVYVQQNALITSITKAIWTTPIAQNYHPLTMLSLTLDYNFGELNAATYHRTNLLLHLVNTILLLLVVLKLGASIRVAGFSALLFAIHPMHVESVAWISERKDVLYTAFYLASILTYLHYLQSKKWNWFLVTVGLALCSLLAKPQAVSFPLALLLIDWWQKRAFTSKLWLEKIPFFALALGMGIATIYAQQNALHDPLSNDTVWLRPFFISYTLILYFVKLLVPLQQALFYPYPLEQIPFYMYLAPLAIAAILYFTYRFRSQREWVFGLGFFLICVSPTLPFKPFGTSILAERYTYLAAVGLFLPILIWLEKRFENEALKFYGITGTFSLIMFVTAYLQIGLWSDNRTLLKKSDENQPSVFVKNILANWYGSLGNVDSARIYSNAAIAQKPDLAYSYFTRAHFCGSNLNLAKLDADKAIALDPQYALAYLLKGLIYAQSGKDDSAFIALRKGLAIKPIADGYLLIGELYEKNKQIDSARYYFKKAVAVEPNNTVANEKLANLAAIK